MKRIKRKPEKENLEISDKVAQSIANWLIRVQSAWASWMNRKVGKWHPRFVGAVMILLLVSMAIISISMIVGGVKVRSKIIAKTGAIKVPDVTQQQDPASFKSAMSAPVERVRRLHLYLDSLSNTEQGKAKLDSIFRLRPGLADSIKMVEHLYKKIK